MKLILVFLGVLLCMPIQALAVDSATCDVIQELDCEDKLGTEEKGELILGVGVGTALGVPDYIGSDETRDLLLPLPFISYNGPRLKVSQSGITGKLFNSEKWFFSLSLSGAIPVDSSDNQARNGMDDLEAVFEYGPSLKYFFQGQDDTEDALYLDLNFREARTLSLSTLDLNASPSLVWRKRLEKSYFSGKVNVGSQFRLEFVSDGYAHYFYGVSPEFATLERPSYRAKGGYAGYRFNNNLRWKKGPHQVSFFLGYASITSASFIDSPLVKRKSHVYSGGAYFYIF